MADDCNFGALTSTGFVEHDIDRAKTYTETNALGPTTDISFRPSALDPLPEDGLAHIGWLYLDPIDGADINNGKTLATAVKTLNAAVALLSVSNINLHIMTANGGFHDLFLDMSATAYVDLANLEIIQCQPATAANVELRQHNTALLGVNPQLKCTSMDNVRMTAAPVGVGDPSAYDWTRALVRIEANPADTYINFCDVVSEAFALIVVSAGDFYINNTILKCGLSSRVVAATYPDIWGNGSGSVDVNTFDDRYTGCMFFPAVSGFVRFSHLVCQGPGGTGSAAVYGQIDNPGAAGASTTTYFDNSTIFGFNSVFRVASDGFSLGAPGFPGPCHADESIVDNVAAFTAMDSGLTAIASLVTAYYTILNTSLNDTLATIDTDFLLSGVAARRWDSEDYRLQIAGVEYAEGLPFSVTSPAIDWKLFEASTPVTVGAWIPLMTDAPYTGKIARFVEGFSPDLKLSANRTNYQSWNDILGNFHAVWDSTVWIVEFTLSSKYFTGTSHSVEWTKLLRGTGTKRLWPDGLQGVLSAVPQDFTATTLDVNLSRPLDSDLYSGWVAKVETNGDDWTEPVGLILPAVTTWVGLWLLDDNFGLAVGGSESATWNGISWVAQGPGPGLGFDPVGDTGGRVLHGSSASNVWNVNDGGIIFRWIGEVWETVASPTIVALRSVWAFSDNLAYAVGDNGVLLTWDGVSWAIVPIPGVGVGDDIYNVWGSNPGDLWITVTNHGILHWDGVSWTDVTPTGAGTTFRAIYGAGVDDIYAGIDQDLWHWDGVNWSLVLTLGNVAVFDQIWGDGNGLFWASASGNDGVDATGALWHWDGISWTKEFPPTGTLDSRTKIYGTASAVYALGGLTEKQILKREKSDSGHYLIKSNTGTRLELSHLYGPNPLADIATVLADLVSITILYLPVEINSGEMPMISEYYVDGQLTPWRKTVDTSEPQEFHSRTLKLKQSAEVVY